MSYFILISVTALLGLVLVACTARTRRFDSIPGEAVAFVAIPHDSYAAFDPDDLAALWPTIRRFELDPAALTLRVGQEYPLHALRVIAVESSGARIGQIAQLEHSVSSGVLGLTPHGTLRGVKVGEAVLTLRPRRAPPLEPFAPLPEWRLTIRVDSAVKG